MGKSQIKHSLTKNNSVIDYERIEFPFFGFGAILVIMAFIK